MGRVIENAWSHLSEDEQVNAAIEQSQESLNACREELAEAKKRLQAVLNRIEFLEERYAALERRLNTTEAERTFRIRVFAAKGARAVKAVVSKVGRVPRLTVLVFLGIYRALPLPLEVRRRISRDFQRASPLLYRRIVPQANGDGPSSFKTLGPPDPPWLHDVVDYPEYRRGFWRLQRDLAAHAFVNGPFTHVVVLPFFAVGGAEQSAMSFSRAIKAAGGGVLVVAADRRLGDVAVSPPDGVLTADLSDYFANAHYDAREAILMALIRMVRPNVVHIVNSEVGWRLLISNGVRMRRYCKIFGSMFAFQFDPATNQKVGYAASFLRDGLPHLDGLISDNWRFIDDALGEYNLRDSREKFHLIYHPSRVLDKENARARIARLQSSIENTAQLQVLWAGRLDDEKRPELVREAAAEAPGLVFHVYGARIVDAVEGRSAQLSWMRNVNFHGPFTNPFEVANAREHHCFMFTSRWEGMPNVLIEFGSLGVPIVAATVGGVGELIDDQTGYPLPEQATAHDYLRAFMAIQADPEEAARRALRLLERIEERHSLLAFEARVAAVPGYLS